MPLTRPTILTSLHGRRFGLDSFGFTAGQPGTRHPYETVTTASTLENSGVSIIASTAATNHTLAEPTAVGIEKTIINNSTFACTVTRSTVAAFGWSTGTDPAGVKITLPLKGSAITMIAMSTSLWMPKSTPGSTLWISVSTSS